MGVYLYLQAPPKGPIQPYDPSYFDEFAAPEYGGFISSESRSSKGLPRGSVAPVPPMRGGMRGGRYVDPPCVCLCLCLCLCWFGFFGLSFCMRQILQTII